MGSGPRGIVRVGDDVWVADELSQSVTRITVATGHTHSIDVGDGPTAVAALGGSVWVAERYSGDLVRIDPAPRSRTGSTSAPPCTGWRSPTVACGSPPGRSPRPAIAVEPSGWRRATCPGIFSGIDPAASTTATPPTPSGSSTTACWPTTTPARTRRCSSPTWRPRCPNPPTAAGPTSSTSVPGSGTRPVREVRASDFVRGVSVRWLVGARPDFYAGIVGGQACIDHPRVLRPEPGRGRGRRRRPVTFHLTAPDPQFLYKLTLLVVPAPPGTPRRRLTSPLPGTGPYRVASYRRRQALHAGPQHLLPGVVRRRPAGRLPRRDQLDQGGRRPRPRRTPCGRAEPTSRSSRPSASGQPRDRGRSWTLSESGAEPGPQQHRQETDFGVLNSSIPPFDNVLARRRFNYAVDRTKAVGSWVARPCGRDLPADPAEHAVLPAVLPLHAGPPDGGYRGPDLARARDLVKASGTRGTR